MEQQTRKFRSRIHNQVPTAEVQPGDVIVFTDGGSYTRSVDSVTKANVWVKQPKGMKPKTKMVERENIKECWRWHKKD